MDLDDNEIGSSYLTDAFMDGKICIRKKGERDMVLLLENPDLAREMGKRGREIVKKQFLITRLLSDYLDLFNKMLR